LSSNHRVEGRKIPDPQFFVPQPLPIPPGGPFWHRVGGKVTIDATKPPLCADEQARLPFQRLKPMGWQTVRPEDFLPRQV